MNKKTLKVLVAGAFVACAFGGFALGLAWATPGQGITSTTIVGPVLLDEVDVHSHGGDWDHDVKIKTRGVTDLYVVHNRIVPGGHTGWHSHPGPSFVMVKSGQATVYCACDNPITRIVYPAGTGFVEDAGCVHIIRNEGTTDLELVAFQLIPFGAPRRIDEPAP